MELHGVKSGLLFVVEVRWRRRGAQVFATFELTDPAGETRVRMARPVWAAAVRVPGTYRGLDMIADQQKARA
jgi:hypothetical protein